MYDSGMKNDKRYFLSLLLIPIFISICLRGLMAQADSLTSLSVDASQIEDPGDSFISVPRTLEPGSKYPLVLLLHGYAGNKELIDSYFGYSSLVNKRGFILAVPNGSLDNSGWRYWNASPACCDFDHRANDDVARLKTILDGLISRYPVDLSRVFVVGHSNGGFMAQRLACDFSEVVTGIISFAGAGSLLNKDCRPSKPVSVLQIHAEDDDTIRFGGDAKGYTGLAAYPGAIQTVMNWSEINTCSKDLSYKPALKLTLSIPGYDTSEELRFACKDRTAVELWKIRAFKGWLHFPHTPLLTGDFTAGTLDFIFSHPRNESR